jgi:hypothetical protein
MRNLFKTICNPLSQTLIPSSKARRISQIGLRGRTASSPLHCRLRIPIGKSRPEVQVNLERWDQTNPKDGKHASAIREPSAPSVRTVLEEVYDLLEDYAPVWYTEEQHERILAALCNRDQ